MTIGVVKPFGRNRPVGFRVGGRNLGRGGPSTPFRHGARGLGAGYGVSPMNRFRRMTPGMNRFLSGAPVTIQDVQLFFNAYLVMKKTFDAESRFLDKMGAYIASDATRSMRSGRKSKKTGRRLVGQRNPKTGVYGPPKAWPPKDFLRHKRYMQWYVNPIKESVAVGPILLPGSKSKYPVPGIHEHGQTVIRLKRRKRRGKFVPAGSYAARYPQRAFMVPALNKNKAKVRELRHSIKP